MGILIMGVKLYGLFKQATVGDNDTPKPSVFDLKVCFYVPSFAMHLVYNLGWRVLT